MALLHKFFLPTEPEEGGDWSPLPAVEWVVGEGRALFEFTRGELHTADAKLADLLKSRGYPYSVEEIDDPAPAKVEEPAQEPEVPVVDDPKVEEPAQDAGSEAQDADPEKAEEAAQVETPAAPEETPAAPVAKPVRTK